MPSTWPTRCSMAAACAASSSSRPCLRASIRLSVSSLIRAISARDHSLIWAMSSSERTRRASSPSREPLRIASTTCATSASTWARAWSRAASAVARMAAPRSTISFEGFLGAAGAGAGDGSKAIIAGSWAAVGAMAVGGIGDPRRPTWARAVVAVGRRPGDWAPGASSGRASSAAGAASSAARGVLVAIGAPGEPEAGSGIRGSHESGTLPRERRAGPGLACTIGGEVGCGAVAGGTSGSFRWYRDAPPLRPAGPAARRGRGRHAMGPRRPDATMVRGAHPASRTRLLARLTGRVVGAAGSSSAAGDDAFDGRPGLPDRFGRALRDLRISVTDRCNFRCPYCMPAELFGRDFAFLPRDAGADVRGDHPAGRDLRGPRRGQAADHGRRAAGAPRPAGAGRGAGVAADAGGRPGRPHADHQRVRAAAAGRGPARRPGCSGSP